ncbi:MAG: nuclear transport factor 2 family protein [Ilumatobacteraceae bacterium]
MALSDADKLAVLNRYADAINGCRPEDAIAMCAPGATVWHNYDHKTAVYADSVGSLPWMFNAVEGLRWETRRAMATSEGFVWEAIIRGTAKFGELAAQTCMVVTLNDDGLIVALDEYIDPASMKPLRG